MSSWPLNRRVTVSLLSVLLGLSIGCGARTYPLDTDTARQSLETALSTWKSGEPSSVLESKSPKIIANDFDWRASKKLLDFKIQDDEASQGSNLRKSVELTLASESGTPERVEAVYLVTTRPAITVVRQELE